MNKFRSVRVAPELIVYYHHASLSLYIYIHTGSNTKMKAVEIPENNQLLFRKRCRNDC